MMHEATYTLDLRFKAHVQHAISLICTNVNAGTRTSESVTLTQHQEADVVRVNEAKFQEINQSAGRGDNQVRHCETVSYDIA